VGSTLPVASGREVVRIFEKFGWTIAAIIQPHHPREFGEVATLWVPDHKEVARGTLPELNPCR
jgi:hypothetical protein